MIRSHNEINNSTHMILNAVRSGNEKALQDLPQQVIDIVDTLLGNPDYLIGNNPTTMINMLQWKVKDLETLVNDLVNMNNNLQDEVNKMKRIFEFMMDQKEAKSNVEDAE